MSSPLAIESRRTLASFQESYAGLLKNGALQFDFPSDPPEPRRFASWDLNLGSHGTLVVAVLVVVVLGIVGACVVRALRDRTPAARRDAPEPLTTRAVPLGSARAALADADALAAAGRYGDAVHVLLACGVAAIETLNPNLLRPADTSRDITRLPAIPEATRAVFAAIARVVELGVFGERPIDRSSYAACRSAFVNSTLAGLS